MTSSSGGSTAGGRRGAAPASRAAREAADDRAQALADLDEDLAVEEELGVDPDDMTDGENGAAPMNEGAGGVTENSEGRPVIRDNRKVDPVSGKVRATPSGSGAEDAAEAAMEDAVVAAAELLATREALALRTEDVQRVAAEYANYRKRVDRDRAVASENATAEVLTALIPVLDDIDAARGAGELEGPFKAVAEKLETTLTGRFGLERYGAEGEVFDPTIHEALLHQTSPDVTEPTVSMVLQPGYRMGDRILRAARVGVTDAEG
jgi:molecular chaperone GrpE